MTKEQILAHLKTHRSEYEEHFGVNKIGLFGSYARDEQTENSDVDIIFEIQKEKSFSMFSYLKLLSTLERALDCKVDLVREEKIKPELKTIVQKDVMYA